jgi:hypothetical protein
MDNSQDLKNHAKGQAETVALSISTSQAKNYFYLKEMNFCF